MNPHFKEIIQQAVNAKAIEEYEVIQNLWSGYGKILRCKVLGAENVDLHSVVVKNVRLPKQTKHPRGWNTDLSHERKVHSYEVETHWYKTYNQECKTTSKTPQCFALDSDGDEVLMVLEDLDDSGYEQRRSSVTIEDIEVCLSWLAHFHATFVGRKPKGLWKSGTYWHLQTRPDELEVLDDIALKNAAQAIDKTLNATRYPSFVHGDAKLANFCFGTEEDGRTKVAAVDFQYVGGGCGMKDVAYFIGSCLYEEDCEKLESVLLDYYFDELENALSIYQPSIDADDMIQEWRDLYYFAWADFHRFLKGWSPSHWKINSYSERVTQKVLASIKKER